MKKLLRTRIVSLDRQKVCGGGVGGRIGKNVLSKPVSGRYISNVHSKIHSPLLQTIMAQLTAVITILRNESELRPDVITQPEFVRVENNGKKIPSVMLQYQFKRKKTRVIGHTSMKPFKNNPGNRLNHISSYKVGLGDLANVHDVVIQEKSVHLNVKKSRRVLHLDGIIFVPVIGGIVIGIYEWVFGNFM